jgi:hypothetical protein
MEINLPQLGARFVLLLSILCMPACNKGAPNGAPGTANVPPAVGPKGSAPDPVALNADRQDEILEKTAPAFKVTAEELFAEARKDVTAATKKYKGAVIEVSGEPTNFDRSGDKSTIILQVSGVPVPVGVLCIVNTNEAWATIAHGQVVKLKGKCINVDISGKLTDCVTLDNCVVVDAGKERPVKVDAEAFTKEYLADKQAAAKKYDKKWLIVEGQYVGQLEENGLPVVKLKGADKLDVKYHVSVFEKSYIANLKPGDKVKFMGQAHISSEKVSEPSFDQTLMIRSGK